MERFEFPLVIFTVLSQVAVGFSFFTTLRLCKTNDRSQAYNEWAIITIVMGISLVASLLHLGRPLAAPRALSNLEGAWLSREVLIFSIFALMCFVTALTKAHKTVAIITVLIGCCGVIIQGFTYAPIALPALYNATPLALFILTAIVLGSSLALSFAKQDSLDFRYSLRVSLWILLILLLVLPCSWNSGGSVLLLTSQAWFVSPLYWSAIILNILVLITLHFLSKANPWFNFTLLFVSAFLIRMVFFGDVIHSSVEIGKIYLGN